MIDLFITVIYQPFLNILVGIYWLLGALPMKHPDMGVAVIIFTIVLRILLLPLSLSQERSEQEKHTLQTSAKALEKAYEHQPMLLRSELKKLMQKNRRIVFSEIIDLTIQIIIALMLWRIFARGLTGEDLHYIYSWMPKIEEPFNLVFLGIYDLTHPNLFLNFLQSFLLFILEMLSMLRTPIKVTKEEVIKYQLTLPIVTFLLFIFLPAGKKLFIITTLLFSICFKLFRMAQDGARALGKKMSGLPSSKKTSDESAHSEHSSHEKKDTGGNTDAHSATSGHSVAIPSSAVSQFMYQTPHTQGYAQHQGQVWPASGQAMYYPAGAQSGNPHPQNIPPQTHQAPPVHTGGYSSHHVDGGEHYGENHSKKEPKH